jgi:hypothetical protein
LICVSIITVGIYYWGISQSSGPCRAFYFTEPSFSNDTIIVTVCNSSNPATSDIYLGFFKNDGGGAIHPDSNTRCVGNLTNNTSTDWIAFSDNDSDGKISDNDTFIISHQLVQIAVIQNGYYDIMFSDEGKVRYLAMMSIDASKV